MTELEIRQAVWTAEWQAYGKDRGDADYWVSKWAELEARGLELRNPNYAIQRVQGMGAGGADVPTYGPYASPPGPWYSPVPAFPGSPLPPPVVPPTPPPTDYTARFDALDAKLASLTAALIGALGRPAPDYVGNTSLPFFGAVTVVLHPQPKGPAA